MTNRDQRPVGWFKLSSAYYADGKIVPLSMGAEILFLRILALASSTSSGGLLTMDQISLVGHKLRSVQKAVDELVEADLLAPVHKRAANAAVVQLKCSVCAAQTQHECSPEAVGKQLECSACDAEMHHQCSPNAALVQGYRITAYRKWNLSSDEPAGQQQSSIEDGQRSHARPPARGKTDRTTDREPLRPASPDGRNVSDPPRDAPRSADGAAQRPPDQGPGKFGSMPGQYRGPVREVPDFAGPRVASTSGGDSLAKSQALAQLAEFAASRGLPFETKNGNGSATALREQFPVWEASGGEDE
ncbi:MAG: hypothetical protein ABWX96_17595 [Propionibacteriaceae bacterium]